MKRRRAGRGWLMGLVCAILVSACASMMVMHADRNMQEQELELIDDQVRQAAISCYASEGRYPQSLDYLVENYGLAYDEERFYVLYDAFASNVMPDISVSIRGSGGL